MRTTTKQTAKFMPGLIHKVKEAAGGQAAEVNKFLATGKGRDSEVGLLISDAMINVPHDIVSSLFDNLVEDVEWAGENAEGEGGKEKLLYRFGKVLIVSKVGEEEPLQGTGGRWKIPGLQRVEEEYIMTRSTFEPFEMKAKVPGGGEGNVKYLIGGVDYGDFEAAVKVFGRAV
jgi:hypothetical protein